jgi:hypothetical protein
MANLLGQNIGTNYKGILNLNTLNGNLSGTLQAVTDGDGNASPLTLSTGEVGISRTIALSAGSSNVRLINETYTINNSGAQTGTATGIFLNATETALNGMGHNLMDLQRGGVSQFSISNNGSLSTVGAITSTGTWVQGIAFRFGSFGSRMRETGDGRFVFYNNAENNFDRLQLGGTTNAFPAIKRNGAAIDFRLADDSASCGINAASLNTASVNVGSNFISIGGDTGFVRSAANTLGISLNGFSNTHFQFRKNDDATIVGIIKGTGSPEGVITANVGSIFMRTDGGAGTSFYVKESGTGNTGWVAK